ncbi:carboxypeptidase regulatory-like domain-containing protein [Aeoliella sp.]|uniref:carboxypeptidase regulatory-like domain-containing protein n=1 Tax=Aeoliella sp. TaxID=2795800 RepID=UPI003CCBC2C0
MNAWYDYALGWFADYYLLSTLLLTVVLLAGSLMQQPARRLVLAWATVGGLALLGVLLAVPGWSVVHLLGDAPPKPDWVVLEEEPAAGLSETPVVKVNPLEGESYYVQPAAPVAEEPAPRESGGVTQTQVVAEIHEVNLSPYFLAPLVAGCIIVLAWLILGGWQTYCMVRSSDPSPPEVESLLSALCDAGDRRPHLRLSHWVATGVALGLLRPMILLPQQYADRQDAEGLRLVLAHELAHLRRGDLWMLASIRGLIIVLWAHPLYWLFRRRVRLDQETLADAAAAALTSRTSYAAQLVGWARQLDSVRPPSLAGAVGLWETKSQLRKRITVLLDERLTILRDCSRKWKLAALVLCSAVALGLSLMTVEPGKANAEETVPSDSSAEGLAQSSLPEWGVSGTAVEWPNQLTGRIVDEQENPIPNVQLRFELQKIHEYAIGRWDESIAALEGQTDNQGRYRFDVSKFPQLVHRPFNIQLSAKAKGYADARTWSWHTLRDTKVSQTPFSPLVMLPGQAVSGRVVDPNGKPVPGAVIKTIADYGNRWVLDPLTTDDDGRFEIMLAEKKKGAAWIASSEWAPKYIDIDAGNPDLGEISLVKGARVSGTVRDQTGQPIAGCAVVMASCADGNLKGVSFPVQYATLTDQQGRYRLPPVQGKHKLYLSTAASTNDRTHDAFVVGRVAPPLVTPRIVDLSPPVSAVEIDFEEAEAVRLSGTVRWNDGKPVANCEVKLSYMPSDRAFGTGIWIAETVTDEAGRYSMDVAKGTDSLHVSCWGSRDDSGVWKMAYTSKRFTDEPTSQFLQIEGAVEQDGSGLDWVLLGKGEEELLNATEERSNAESDADPREEKSDAAPTEGTLEAGAGTLTLAGGQTGQGTKNFRFEAQKTPNLVEGVCLAPDGKPANGVTVTLYRSRQLADNFKQLATATTGPDGRFEFADVLTKDEVATAEKDWREAASRNENEVFWLVTQKPGFVTRYASAAKPALAAGVNARVTLEPSATLTGAVTDPDGKPIEGAQVRVSRGATTPLPPGIHNAVTDAEGRYSIDDAAPFDRQEYEKLLAARGDAIYSLSFWAAAEPSVGESEEILPPVLSVSHPDFALKRVAYDAIPGTKDVQLEVASQIEGRVQQVNGEPLANGRVRAIRAVEEGPDPTYEQFVLTAQTDSDGSYQFDQVPAGEYDIQLMVPHTAVPDALPRPLSGVNVGPDQRVQAPDLRMERGGLVEVQLVDTETKKPISLAPGADAYVQIEHLKSGRFDRHRGFRMPVGQDAKFTVRCLPGKTSISVLQAGTPYDDETGAAPEWSDANENAKEVDVLEGGTITVDVEMKNQEARNKLGAIGLEATKLAGDGKPFEAAEKMSEAVDLFNGDELTSALVMRGRYWLQAEEYGKAIADYEQVLSMDPTPRAAPYVRAQLIMLLVNCKDESFRDYDRAIEEGASAIGDTKSLELVRPLYSALAKAYEATGQPDEAIALRERLSKVEDGAVGESNLQRLLERARELEQKRDFAGQVNLYEQIIADGEASGTTYEAIAKNNLAYLFAAAPAASFRDGKRAVKLATEAIELFGQPTAQLYDTLAAAYAEADDFEKAIATEQKALELATPAEKPNMQQRLELYKAGKPYRMEQVPAASSKATQPSPTEATQVREEPPRTDFTIVIAKHMMLLDGKEFITWQELEDRIAKLPDPSKARLHYRITHAAMDTARELQRAEHRLLEEKFKFNGYSIGGFSLRGSHRFDQIETVADLVPNSAHACVGQVVDSDGNPVEGAEVVFAPPVDETLAYRGRDISLEDGKLRHHLDDVVAVSDDAGRFTVYPADEKLKYYLIAVHPEHGFALATRQGREAGAAIQLQRWASINSTILPAEGMEQSASVSTSIAEKDGLPDLSINIHVPDRRPQPKAGEFNFPCVPPNMACYYRRGIKRPQGVTISLPTKELELKPGEVHEITLGGLTPDEADRLEMHEKLFEDLQGAREKTEEENKEPVKKLDDSEATFSAMVVDAESGEPIKEFLALPGTSFMEGFGWQWQTHMIRNYQNGELIWPPKGRKGYDRQAIRVEADGYVPFETGEVLRDAPQRGRTIRLHRSAGVSGRLVDVDGKPVADAKVAIAMCRRTVRIDGGSIALRDLADDASLRDRWSQPRWTTTAEDGTFTLPDESAPAALIATHPSGVAIINLEWVREHPDVHLEPWGRIEGQVLWGETPGADESIEMSARGHRDPEGLDVMLMLTCSDEVTSGDDGRYVFDKVPPGVVQVSRISKPVGEDKIRTLRPVQFVDVLPGVPTKMIFGGGRPVVGKLVGLDSWEGVQLSIGTDAPPFSGPVDMIRKDWAAWSEFMQSEAGKQYSKQNVQVNDDGTFRIERVPAARFNVSVTQQQGDEAATPIGRSTFTMETITPGEEDTSLDIGEITVAPAQQ